jgi:serine protease Do
VFAAITLLTAGSLYGRTEDKETSQGYLGVHMRKITEALREIYDLEMKEGVFVSYVENESPAEEAGMKERDVIIAFDGNSITSPKELKDEVREKAPGEHAKVRIIRNGDEQNLEVVIGEQPDERHWYSFYGGDRPGPWDFPVLPHRGPREMTFSFGPGLEVKVAELTEDLAPYFDVDENDGILVLHVFADSPADKAGLKAGDVITKLAGQITATVDDLKEAVGDLDSGEEFRIAIVRNGKRDRLEGIAEDSSSWESMGLAPMHYPGMIPPLWWIPRSFHDDLDEKMEGFQEDLNDLQEELKDLKEKI